MSNIEVHGSLLLGPYKGYRGRADFDSDDGSFNGELTETRDVVTFVGRDLAELTKAFQESIDDYLDFCESRGEQPEKPVSGKLLLRMPPRLHHELTVLSVHAGQSLNQYVVDVLSSAVKADAQPSHAPGTAAGQTVSFTAQWHSELALSGSDFFYPPAAR